MALLAFAANSILCRLALRDRAMDPAGFTAVRIASGAAMLLLVTGVGALPVRASTRSWASAGMLFLYAAAFSFAYLSLSAGTGALLLFGSVQGTMLLVALSRGERLGGVQWLGVATAVGGLIYLVLPGLTAPSPLGAALMITAGVAWGAYSVLGRGSNDPVGQTRDNFLLAVPLALLLALAMRSTLAASGKGLLLAVVSGAITSGLGYVVWYRALRHLDGVAASLVQLATPVLAAAGGVLFLAETLSSRLLVAAVLVLGGIALSLRKPLRA